ncbi:MAG: HAMP domain-containing histidine kinase, partial [Candidatus Marinimicrobia bacterium]|nr:HAMP domain-containing histidine kinase [Candidatus Neomarinimicrobiota bacterium]
MSIRLRFLLTFFGLVLLGVTAISGISILFVRDHITAASRDNLDREARYLATMLVDLDDHEQYAAVINDFSRYTGFQVELLNADFLVEQLAGSVVNTTAPLFTGIAPLAGPPTVDRHYVRITASEAELITTLTNVRFIILAGVIVVLVLTILTSWIVADKVSKPIRVLAGAARSVASGQESVVPLINRTDEIGELSRDVSAMATRLQEDIESLRKLNQAQEDFIAAVSHEVRNPIFSARGYLEAAIEERESGGLGSDDPLLEYLRKTLRNLLRLHHLFADLLTLVKLQFGGEAATLETVQLEGLVNELRETFAPQAADRGIDLKLEHGQLAVKGRLELLRIILANLLSNAIRHTPTGSVELNIA